MPIRPARHRAGGARRRVMSGTVSRGREAGQQGEARAAAEARGSRGRGRWVALGIAVVVAAGAVSAWQAGVFSPAASSGSGQHGAPAPATRAVTRQDLAATTPETATLGYAGSFTVTGQGGGTLTWLPPAGTVIRQGQLLYETGNGSPVVLLYGRVPAWRALDEGITGQDVSQLNHDLVDLGYAGRADIVALGWDYYSWETAQAMQQLEEHLGVSAPPGSLSLGQVVTIPLDASGQSEVKAGDTVSITLPDGTTTTGMVSSVGTVATTTSASGSGGSPASTIPVQVTLTDPGAAGTLDQAPVTVYITIASSPGPVLAVPVTALVAQSPGGYVVEVVGPGNTRRWVPVTPGIYDGADGLVQVTGALTPGERVVVAAS